MKWPTAEQRRPFMPVEYLEGLFLSASADPGLLLYPFVALRSDQCSPLQKGGGLGQEQFLVGVPSSDHDHDLSRRQAERFESYELLDLLNEYYFCFCLAFDLGTSPSCCYYESIWEA